MELRNKTVAILIEDLYEDMEFWYPYYRMKEAGANVVVVGTGKSSYTGKNGLKAQADRDIHEVSVEEFDAVIIPGGYAPDRLRRHNAILEFVRQMDEEDKIIAFICHAGWVPISAKIVLNREVTSFFAIKDDLINAGAKWVDTEVVRDANLVSSRKPDDLPAFCRMIIDALAPVKA
ncbi:MAG TPA: type 1 glutamine amidotransferase domain-containing protein [Balneolales bacterium]|nr:type 1 glutamine amidotransferase domain-containing protein [Balneolales bacterium]